MANIIHVNMPLLSAGGSYFLDDAAESSTVAVALVQLSSSYSGSCIRVRESGGDTETDIGFSAGLLDTAAIASHCGANNGFVVTWYDQSGNGHDLTNAIASTQPQIYNGSSVITFQSESAIHFSSATKRLSTASAALNAGSYTGCSVFSRFGQAAATTLQYAIVDKDLEFKTAGFPSDNNFDYVMKTWAWRTGTGGQGAANTWFNHVNDWDGSNTGIYINNGSRDGTTADTGTKAEAGNVLRLGDPTTGSGATHYTSAMILWHVSVSSTTRTLIQNTTWG